MINIVLAFVTGLTTGGLSCLAVQGGLLTSSLAGQIEKDFQVTSPKANRKKGRTVARAQKRAKLAQPIAAFLAAKVSAYTVLGFLLGLLGQMFQLSPFARAFLQIAIGIFMLGSALRMLNVHPIFRYFAFEPPAFLRRKLRRAAANGTESSLSTPLFLGFLTVLIPCGVTQAMMAVALGSGNPAEGAALMFAFTLGTSPVFFAVAYFATKLGSRLEKHFMRFVAVVMLILAIITIDSGITLAGSPISLTRFVTRTFSGISAQNTDSQEPAAVQSYVQDADASSADSGARDGVITLIVKNDGYHPDVLHVKSGVAVKLRLVTNNVRSCSRAFVIPALNFQKVLESTGEVTIDIPAQAKGTRMTFTCSMGMYGGIILFDS